MERGAGGGTVATATPRHGFASILCNIVLAGFFSIFVYAQLTRPGPWNWLRSFPIVMQVSVTMILFLTRRPSLATSSSVVEWIIGIAGTLFPMLMSPAPSPGALTWLGAPLQAFGLALSTAALLSIGRSIAVVPANRGIRTGGAFRVVRHPIYAAYTLTFVGYVLCEPTVRNAAVGATTLVLLAVRAVFEERFLMREPQYRAYAEGVRWRMLPGLF